MRRRARLGSRIILTVLTLMLTLLVAEGFFRVIGYDFDRQEQKLSEVPIFFRQPRVPTGDVFFRREGPAVWKGPVLHLGQKVTVHYDKLGFRNPPGLNDWEIVVVGDSFVELGHLPLAKLFTRRLGRRLGVRVKNLGVSKTGPWSQIHYLKTWGKAPSTKHAVIVFFEGNDIKDVALEANALKGFRSGGNRSYRRITPQTSLLKAATGLLTSAPELQPERGEDQLARWTNANLYLPGLEAPSRVFSWYRAPARRHFPPSRSEQLNQAIAAWGAAARGLDLEPWLLYMPCKNRIWHRYLEFDPDVSRKIQIWKPTDLPLYIKELAEAEGIRFLNAVPGLLDATARGQMVFNPYDSHLSEIGSRVLARAMAEQMRAVLEASGELAELSATANRSPSRVR